MGGFNVSTELSEGHGTNGITDRQAIPAKYSQEIDKAWMVNRRDGPLELLDLPLDILKCIFKEVGVSCCVAV